VDLARMILAIVEENPRDESVGAKLKIGRTGNRKKEATVTKGRE
jgi:hypothetical protein